MCRGDLKLAFIILLFHLLFNNLQEYLQFFLIGNYQVLRNLLTSQFITIFILYTNACRLVSSWSLAILTLLHLDLAFQN